MKKHHPVITSLIVFVVAVFLTVQSEGQVFYSLGHNGDEPGCPRGFACFRHSLIYQGQKSLLAEESDDKTPVCNGGLSIVHLYEGMFSLPAQKLTSLVLLPYPMSAPRSPPSVLVIEA